jgi:putative transposase
VYAGKLDVALDRQYLRDLLMLSCFSKQQISSEVDDARVFGQNVGIKEVSDKVWLVSFMQYDLGFFDHETGRITSAENPFGAKVLPMCPE